MSDPYKSGNLKTGGSGLIRGESTGWAEPAEVEPLDAWDDDGRHFRIVMRERLVLEEFLSLPGMWCAIHPRGIELLRRIVELKR